MNFYQLEYIAAVDRLKHFGKAAAYCHVTQPTLSAMIQKLEEELGVQLFDRSAQPVVTTECGKEVVAQALRVLNEVDVLKQLAGNAAGIVRGEIHVGIIPTVAVYLLPLLVDMMALYPEMKLNIQEMTTDNIVSRLRSGEIHSGILATGFDMQGLTEDPLFLEPLLVFLGRNEAIQKQTSCPEILTPRMCGCWKKDIVSHSSLLTTAS